MRITFLGTGSGSTLGSKRSKSSIMLSSKEAKIILDMGNGSNSKLEDIGFPEIEGIFVTHLHIDHINGIFDYLVQRKIRGMRDVKIFSPPGLLDLLNVYKKIGNDISADIREEELPKAKIGDIEVYSVKACHKIYAVSYVITDGRTKILYSGDTKEPCDEIDRETKDADLIIHEVTCIQGCENYGHTSVKDLKSGKRIIATHIPAQIENEIKEALSGRAIMAYDGMIIDV
ncbi:MULTISPECIES: MBL fold metallo-hydrolase [Acidianus]|uniref:Beta-lactamase n=1 Tax=Candidatus Acidianus copahuensis TaxID=1160895 RepID=A0A031LR68_9CREN|nr:MULTISPECIES: MBL fold metallo-hydrolase [Acidianus]EZQ10877.1 beta-lactamase [Candidatus Acidianus copahuensis]NON63225.1 MBL fold metallo-hydrolase [Acidianus sp. RZ1]